MEFLSPYRHGFARLAACTIPSRIADPVANARTVEQVACRCAADGVALAVFPELCLSGYAIDDLLLQDALLDATVTALHGLACNTAALPPMLLVGAPLRWGNRVYNTAVAIHRGRILGVVPKTYLPIYREFHERRHFASGAGLRGATVTIGSQEAPFGADLIFEARDVPGLRVGVEICEDLWIPTPPSSFLALAGATVLANLSASPITIGRARSRSLLCRSQSVRCLAAYVYTAAGDGESTTDLAWDGQAGIFENGVALAQTARFQPGGGCAVADVDLDLLRQERARMGTFDDAAREHTTPMRMVRFDLDPSATARTLRRSVPRFPFVPADPARLAEDCHEAYNIQVSALAQRLRATGIGRLVIGVSGGLDSTQALIVCAKAMDRLGLPRTQILAYTMPGFATGEASRAHAHQLMRELGVTPHELDIRPTARQMLAELHHPFVRGEAVHDTTFENVQAGLRTDFLFRLANQHGGFVVGTGDLSELALGWCTYGVGDQMAHYNVNAGVPKTLIQHLIRWAIQQQAFPASVNATLDAILRAEISPELVPVVAGGTPQSTEAVVGPYELADFFLFYTLRHGFRPSKIAFLALQAWRNADQGDWPPGFPADRMRGYELGQIRHWLEVFLHRFFAFSQFKRSAMPNGPKVTDGGSLSPRGDWRAPSDGNAQVWLADLDQVPRD